MIDSVFISDLHLNPGQPEITDRFIKFVHWASKNTQNVYILGDFFHVWAGDDSQNTWSDKIAAQLSWLNSQGVNVYYMHGNRDFLLGKRFIDRASMKKLTDPTIVSFHGENVLLTHGDRYCTKDRSHQWFRRVTRNQLFYKLFLTIPYNIRKKLVMTIRHHSQVNQNKPSWKMEIVSNVLLSHMTKKKVKSVIHGHIHQPGLKTHHYHGKELAQFILSDWDDDPIILCYNEPYKFYYFCLKEISNA